jgi:hypothetical protein
MKDGKKSAAVLVTLSVLISIGTVVAQPNDQNGQCKEKNREYTVRTPVKIKGIECKVMVHDNLNTLTSIGSKRKICGTFNINELSKEIKGDYVSISPLYMVDSKKMFNVSYAHPTPKIKKAGAQVKIIGENYEVTAHDNPTAFLKIKSNESIAFSFEAGYNLTKEKRDVIDICAENFSAAIISNSITISNGIITVEKKAMFFIRKPIGIFDVHRGDICEAIENGAMGAETIVQRNEGGGYENDTMIYDNVSINITDIGQRKVSLTINGEENTTGKTIAINIGNKIFSPSAETIVKYDNETIKMAKDVFDILDPNDDGSHPEYLITRGEDGTQILVSIPHFSEHTITIYSLRAEGVGEVRYILFSMIGALALITFAAFGMFRKEGGRI